MKKILFLIPILFILLIPNVKAESFTNIMPNQGVYFNSNSASNEITFNPTLFLRGATYFVGGNFSDITTYRLVFRYDLSNFATNNKLYNVSFMYYEDNISQSPTFLLNNQACYSQMGTNNYDTDGSEVGIQTYTGLVSVYCPNVKFDDVSVVRLAVNYAYGYSSSGWRGISYTMSIVSSDDFSSVTDAINQQNYYSQITNEKISEQIAEQEKTNEELGELNDNITNSDSSSATDSAGGFFNNFNDDDFGLSGIITAPLNTIKTITSNSCSPINLTIPFVNKKMTLPCMTDIYEEHFGSFLDIYQIITFGMISYWVCVQIYAMVKGFKNPDKDEIEVMDL